MAIPDAAIAPARPVGLEDARLHGFDDCFFLGSRVGVPPTDIKVGALDKMDAVSMSLERGASPFGTAISGGDGRCGGCIEVGDSTMGLIVSTPALTS